MTSDKSPVFEFRLTLEVTSSGYFLLTDKRKKPTLVFIWCRSVENLNYTHSNRIQYPLLKLSRPILKNILKGEFPTAILTNRVDEHV